jgi:hypothetical protein
VSGRADRWIRRITIGSVAMLALIAGTVSYLHMHDLVALHGQPGWVAVLTPLSVDGMIVAASTTLLAESRSGGRGGLLPWALLVVGSIASLAANVAVAEPTVIGRVIAAWPSFALIGSYELLMGQVRRAASPKRGRVVTPTRLRRRDAITAVPHVSRRLSGKNEPRPDVRKQAWQWAVANRSDDGSLPSGKTIAGRYQRHERWGRLVKAAGIAGEFADAAPS